MKIRILRESRFGYSARDMQISLNGSIVAELQNGEEKTFDVPSGTHSLSFQIGKRTHGFASVTTTDDDSETFITCWIESNGNIAIRSAHSNVQLHTDNTSNHSGSSGGIIALCIVAAIIFFFLFFRIEIGFFLLPIS